MISVYCSYCYVVGLDCAIDIQKTIQRVRSQRSGRGCDQCLLFLLLCCRAGLCNRYTEDDSEGAISALWKRFRSVFIVPIVML